MTVTRTPAAPARAPQPPSDAESVAAAVIDGVPRLMRWIRAANRAGTARELTVPQMRALMLLRRSPGVGISAVAEHQGIGLASASALVDRLVRRGLVDRAQDPDERRRVVLTLTSDGSARLATAIEGTRHHLARALSERTPAERSAIAGSLALLLDSLGSWDPDPATTPSSGHGR
jgi:DNA-binding MarR family transcriptional regulator